MIKVPSEGEGLLVVASVSGGKDSTALMLALREAEIEARYVFADTQWEASDTYEYLDYLRQRLGIAIDVVGVEGGMRARVRYRAGFPGRMQRWCTRELKVEPLRAYHDRLTEKTGIETISAMGIRAQESASRAHMPEWADESDGERSWGGYVWRPLIRWSVEDVLHIHRRHGIKVNPLYQRGHDRVGCYPCIFENKEGIRLLTAERIDEIRAFEEEITSLREQRNLAQPGRYAHKEAAFFQTIRKGFSGIDAVVAWARTDTGGRQLPLFAPEPRGGCMRWGLCETSSGPSEQEDRTPDADTRDPNLREGSMAGE
jgi:3'-phosphoadenosine 5'-phosphosulfate sulfotransferase (PAPS reductase)/FAD synthetase